jgi:hypothetical protein
MGADRRFEIPERCRALGRTAGFVRRLQAAEDFIRAFVERVAPPKSLDDSDEAWTQAIRKRFIEICPKACYALPSDHMTAKGEYLADCTWAEESNGKRLLLACESEWGTCQYGRTYWPHVEYGFEKLLAIKAPFKVLIFSSYDKPGGSKPNAETNFSFGHARQRLGTSLRNYAHHIPGEVYIFIDFPQTGIAGDNGRYQSLIWLATKPRADKVELQVGPTGNLIRPTEFNVQWA